MQQAERERIEAEIEHQRGELRSALRDLTLSAAFALNLPKLVRKRPLPWALAAVGVTAWFVLRRRKRKSKRPRFSWR